MFGKYRQYKKELLFLLKENVENKYPKQISKQQYQNARKIIRYLFKKKALVQLIPWENIEKFVFCTKMYDLKSKSNKISEIKCVVITLQAQQEIKKWMDMFVYPDHITVKVYDSTHNTNPYSVIRRKEKIFFESINLEKGKITFKVKRNLKINIRKGLEEFSRSIKGEASNE